MKSTILRTFKQVYNDKVTKEKKEYEYQVAIVRDTNDYKYRILNVTSGTLWAKLSFNTFEDADLYLSKHPHYQKDTDAKLIDLGKFY